MAALSNAHSEGCVIGLDIGGTKIAGGLVAFPEGSLFADQVIPTRAEGGAETVLRDAFDLAHHFLHEANKQDAPILGIGIGVAELVDPNGNITSGHAIPWKGVPVQERFAHLAPTVVESDVRAGALAEACFGAGRAFKTFAYVTVGTGISCCLVQERTPYAGARGNALILASGAFTTVCHVCGTQLEPVLEEIASGPALVTRFNRHRPGHASRGEDVMRAVSEGDPAAIEVVQSAGEALGNSVGFMVNILDPEAVVVGGGLGTVGGLYWTSFVRATRDHVWADTSRDLPILPAALGPTAGLIGAAATVWQRAQVGG